MKVQVYRWKSLYNDSMYFSTLDPVYKMIEGVKFMEVTTSMKVPNIQFIRADSLVKSGTETHEL